MACARVASDPRFREAQLAAQVEQRGREFWQILETTEVPSGGWAYYDDPPYSKRPNWATSFCTALVLPALDSAGQLGWIEDPGHVQRALRALQRSNTPGWRQVYAVVGVR